jgi:eukaryotic-like serine/threonine-protein kinase
MIVGPGSQVFGPDGAAVTVGEYVGHGGCGAVFKIKDADLAIKTLTIPFGDPDILRTFFNEGRLAMEIAHSNVIKYVYFHDGQTHPSLMPYILMEYAEGGTLGGVLKQARAEGKRFSVSELRDMMRQLIAGITAINEKFVHRDIKPANILLKNGVLKISDFGLAKLVEAATRSQTLKGWGSNAYLAPEGWKQEANTIALDIYAMGMVFYELATLKHPFPLTDNDDQNAWFNAHMLTPVAPPSRLNPDLPPAFSQMILKMVEKSVARRAKSWAEISGLLESAESTVIQPNALIDGMLKKRLDVQAAAQSAQLEAAKKAKENREFCERVMFQFRQSVAQPIAEFLEQFNAVSANEKIRFHQSETPECGAYTIYGAGVQAKMEFRPLIEDEFWRIIPVDDYGRVCHVRRNHLPKVNGRKVQGFGFLSLADKRGLNFLLVENPADPLYGEWLVMLNSSNLMYAGPERPKPFPFGFGEMEEAISMINVMNRFHSRVEPLNIDFVNKLLADSISDE